jgi:hypothetical protein
LDTRPGFGSLAAEGLLAVFVVAAFLPETKEKLSSQT